MKKKPAVVHTRELGVRVFVHNRDATGCAMQYEDTYSDGSSRVRYGRSVRLYGNGFWPSDKSDMEAAMKKQTEEGTFRPDLFLALQVAKHALTELESACRFADEPKKKIRKTR